MVDLDAFHSLTATFADRDLFERRCGDWRTPFITSMELDNIQEAGKEAIKGLEQRGRGRYGTAWWKSGLQVRKPSALKGWEMHKAL
jgi:hypothetical protein